MIALALFLLFGLVLGTGYFRALAWNVRALARGAGLLTAFALPLARFGFIAAGLTFAALHGAGALAAATLGFLLARAGALHVARAAP